GELAFMRAACVGDEQLGGMRHVRCDERNLIVLRVEIPSAQCATSTEYLPDRSGLRINGEECRTPADRRIHHDLALGSPLILLRLVLEVAQHVLRVAIRDARNIDAL